MLFGMLFTVTFMERLKIYYNYLATDQITAGSCSSLLHVL